MKVLNGAVIGTSSRSKTVGRQAFKNIKVI